MNLDTVYIVRHGIAEDYSSAGSDAARRLTPTGIEKTRLAAQGMRRIGVAPQMILSSPLARAKETAEIIATVLGGTSLQISKALSPGLDFESVLREANKPPKPHAVMLVGHQPDLGMLASLLLSGDPETAYLPLRKASAACIEVSGSMDLLRGTLQWFLTPAQLRGLAGK